MRLFILLCQLFVTMLLIVVILFQKSESGLGIGGGTMGGMMTVRGTANLLTRLTAFLAGLFIVLNLWLVYLTKKEVQASKIITAAVVEKTPSAVPLEKKEAPSSHAGVASTKEVPAPSPSGNQKTS
ncbi:preprotein translocase subunit SecG [Candidatus Hepatobacter penaei]|uniref:preprotein translocase subunit SecG n=1 Tax=Candidatus Hepatobacter penaei TaxID=1274402 RepID=UPI0004F3365B|nr:preprotein translocase subunit SecG [Candidatus Hepatobacter penaei]TGW15590.1 preprotein translocase subunit SecG [bacterium NHP-B]